MSDTLLANLVQFGRVLRGAGLAVTPADTHSFAQSVELLGVDRRNDVKAAGRVIFARRREELAAYDAAFELFWRRGTGLGGPDASLPRLAGSQQERAAETPRGTAYAVAAGEAPSEPRAGRTPTLLERLGTMDFAAMSRAELREAALFLATLTPALPLRPSRRYALVRRGRLLAPRALLRRSLATGGEALDWRWRRRRLQPRPLVVIADISGSMECYTRLLLRFAHTLGRSGAALECFVFATRLTRITRELHQRDADEALQRATRKVADWSGGTRIGESLRELNRRWVRRTVRSGAVVLLISDGWERGDPALLAAELKTLRRSCHRLIWLDPLAGLPGFEPATGGLRAALPLVDEFLPCGDLLSLLQLSRRLGPLLRPAQARPSRSTSSR